MGGKARIPDCRECGACCLATIGLPDGTCDVEEDEIAQLPAELQKQLIYPEPYELMARTLSGRKSFYAVIPVKVSTAKSGPLKGIDCSTCVCLEGSVMDRVSCSIYEQRPKSCRVALMPGDPTCRKTRQLIENSLQENGINAKFK